MIQTCPACHTRFAVAEIAFAKGARKLRCAQCKHTWLANAAGEMVTEPETTPPTPPIARTIPTPEPEAEPPPLPKIAVVAPPTATELLLERIPRLPARWAWGIVAAVLCLMLGIAWFGRTNLAARFPTLASFYTVTGMIQPDVFDALDVELTKAEKCQISGRTMLCLAGQISNNGDAPQKIPALYITALDAKAAGFTDEGGKPILNWTLPAQSGKLLPGESKDFSLTEPYPDQAITDFDYGFIDDDAP